MIVSNPAGHDPDGTYDIAIIGAGGIGCAIARELAKTNAKVIVLEAADDVTQGATKGNSGIVHAGFDDAPGSTRAKYCPTGCRMFPQLDRELHFGFQRNTSLVIAKGADDEAMLQKLLERGRVNGVENLRIIDRDELRRREPHIHPDATAALLAEDAGTIIPYEYAIALAENAADNGVEFRLRREVSRIEAIDGGAGGFTITAKHWEPVHYTSAFAKRSRQHHGGAGMSELLPVSGGIAAAAVCYAMTGEAGLAGVAFAIGFIAVRALLRLMLGGPTHAPDVLPESSSLTTPQDVKPRVSFEPSKGTVMQGDATIELIKASFVVNAAGCHSDLIASMVGDTHFTISERYGEYVLLKKTEGKRVSSTLFPCPGPMGKGVLVQNTVWGNLILGPTARDKMKKDPVTGKLVPNDATLNESKETIIRSILAKCRELVPDFNAKEVIHTFMGARAKTTRGDWIIEPCATCKHFVHAAGIDSPGLAASPAIAVAVVAMLAEQGAPVKDKNPTFNPLRAPIVIPKKGMKDAFGNPLKYGPPGAVTDPRQNVVCKCEKVTEAEIIEACRRSLPIDSTQAIRKRTRAGMGHCQGDPSNYDCERRVAEIIARETGLDVEQVGRRPWPASSLMPNRFFTDADREWIESLSH